MLRAPHPSFPMAAAAADLPTGADARFGVFGMGVTGRAAATLLAAHGARLCLAESRAEVVALLQPLFADAQWCTGELGAETFAGCDAVLLSPGIAASHPAIVAAHARGIPVFGEVELLVRFAPQARIAAITGTNGKSTTTALCGHLLQAQQQAAFAGGNLGEPISNWLMRGTHEAFAVLELSSYQIDGLQSFVPDVAALLNVSNDHLARYGSFSAYLASKARLLDALGTDGIAVLNADDRHVRQLAERVRGTIWWFSSRGEVPTDGLVCGPGDVAIGVGALAPLWPAQSLAHARLLGQHNRENALAALLTAQALLAPAKAPTPQLWQGYQQFSGLPHRLAPVGTLHGATWLDDSKATNDASAATAVRAMHVPFVLLLGGQDKGGGWAELLAALQQHPAKAIFLFGQAAPVLQQALAQVGLSAERFLGMLDACEAAEGVADVGDAVLLSPACTSFDAFVDYRQRGEAFARWVRQRRDDQRHIEG